MYTEEDLLPLSGLQHLAFCDRRWALIHLEQQWEENLFTAEGKLLHEKAHSAEIESRPRFWFGERFRCAPFALAFPGKPTLSSFFPVAQSRVFPCRAVKDSGSRIQWSTSGSRQTRQRGLSHSALRAGALSGRDAATDVPRGCIFDGQKRRRQEIAFDLALRRQVEQLAARMHAICQSRITPPAIYEKKCDSCSMLPGVPSGCGRLRIRHPLLPSRRLRQPPPKHRRHK